MGDRRASCSEGSGCVCRQGRPVRSLPAAPTQCMLGTHTANAWQTVIVYLALSVWTTREPAYHIATLSQHSHALCASAVACSSSSTVLTGIAGYEGRPAAAGGRGVLCGVSSAGGLRDGLGERCVRSLCVHTPCVCACSGRASGVVHANRHPEHVCVLCSRSRSCCRRSGGNCTSARLCTA